MPGTVTLHGVLRAPPARVYQAFLDPAALVKWLPPHGFMATVHECDVREGGGCRMSFTHFATGASHGFSVHYVELLEGRRIRYTDTFDPGLGLPGEMDVVVEFGDSIAGTSLRIVQAGIPDAIPVDACYQGWQESLEQLARLVEPEIPDA